MNMYNWIDQVIHDRNKKPFPLLTYPSVQMMYITVKELVSNSLWQAMGMRLIADQYDMCASTSYMDLSVEAEAFGAHTVYGVDEIPTIIGKLIETEEDADNLRVPEVGEGRTGICIDGVTKALRLINDRPVFANCIGPFSLAGRHAALSSAPPLSLAPAFLPCYSVSPDLVRISRISPAFSPAFPIFVRLSICTKVYHTSILYFSFPPLRIAVEFGILQA